MVRPASTMPPPDPPEPALPPVPVVLPPAVIVLAVLEAPPIPPEPPDPVVVLVELVSVVSHMSTFGSQREVAGSPLQAKSPKAAGPHTPRTPRSRLGSCAISFTLTAPSRVDTRRAEVARA